MTHRYFVTGTDTEVGKTFVAAALLTRARELGYRVAACKPVAAGAEDTPAGLRNDDALALMASLAETPPYHQVNPICLRAAIAPHIAAAEEGVELSVASLMARCSPFLAGSADFGLMEGAGGWRVPLNRRETLADLAVALDMPVILVVAMRLGCINHALLSAQAIAADGLRLAGWVANSPAPQPMARYRENVQSIEERLDAPLLGEVGFQPGAAAGAAAASLKLPDALEELAGRR